MRVICKPLQIVTIIVIIIKKIQRKKYKETSRISEMVKWGWEAMKMRDSSCF